jgi:hypothetical protein
MVLSSVTAEFLVFVTRWSMLVWGREASKGFSRTKIGAFAPGVGNESDVAGFEPKDMALQEGMQ